MTPAQQVFHLLRDRSVLVKARNLYVDKPFFLFRLALRRKVTVIDKAIAEIDARIRRVRD